MNEQEIFALIDDWLETANDLADSTDQFEVGRSTQLYACADQLLKVIAISDNIT